MNKYNSCRFVTHLINIYLQQSINDFSYNDDNDDGIFEELLYEGTPVLRSDIYTSR